MKIDCIMLKKDRTIAHVGANPMRSYFRWNMGIYVLSKDAINIVKREGKINSIPQLVYIEGNPNPLSPNVAKANIEFLNQMVIENALRATAKPTGMMFDILKDYAKNPGKIMLIVFAIVILVAALGGMFHLF